jgi:hypothetical protein
MTTEVPEQSYNLSESKEAQSIPYLARLIKVDRVGFEPTTCCSIIKSEPYYYQYYWRVSTGIALICCINPIVSASTQSSATLPSTIFEMPVEVKETFLLVGGMP